MLAASASLLNINVVVLDQGPHDPAKQVIAPSDPALMHIDGSFTDPVKVRELASKVDILTVEIEHVNVAALDAVEKEGIVSIHPRPSTIRLIQDKLLQKQRLLAWGVPVAEFLPVESTVDAIHEAGQRLGVPFMLKSRTFAYDGRGNYVLRDLAHAQEALDALAGRPLYVEKWVPFAKEAAVMVVKGEDGEVRCYPAVETHHRENICHLVFAPLRSRDPTLSPRIQAVAQSAIKNLAGAGVFGVEMFVMEDGE
jgi:phosphoribosylaminoimidazole carboxylase